jgi:hypothetical protein
MARVDALKLLCSVGPFLPGRDIQPLRIQLFVKGPVVSGVPRQLVGVLGGEPVYAFEPLEARAVTRVRVPARRPAPLGLLTPVPGQCLRGEGQPNGRSVGRHRGSRSGQEVI